MEKWSQNTANSDERPSIKEYKMQVCSDNVTHNYTFFSNIHHIYSTIKIHWYAQFLIHCKLL